MNDEQSVAEYMVANDSENKNTDIVGSKLVRRSSHLFVTVVAIQDSNIQSYRRHLYMKEAELVLMSDIFKNYRHFFKKITDDGLQKKTVNKTLTMKIQE